MLRETSTNYVTELNASAEWLQALVAWAVFSQYLRNWCYKLDGLDVDESRRDEMYTSLSWNASDFLCMGSCAWCAFVASNFIQTVFSFTEIVYGVRMTAIMIVTAEKTSTELPVCLKQPM